MLVKWNLKRCYLIGTGLLIFLKVAKTVNNHRKKSYILLYSDQSRIKHYQK